MPTKETNPEDIRDDSRKQADFHNATAEKRTVLKNKERFRKKKHIAIVTMGVKLGDETKGYTRFRFLAEMLAAEGFRVDLITSSFQHWEKAQRDCSKECYQDLPYKVQFIEEPGYSKNLDLARIKSHAQAARNLRSFLESTAGPYDLIYAEIPPNDVARVCAEFAHVNDIPFVADINDLWPEAMRMVIDIPLISSIVFHPFKRDAKICYQLLDAAVGTSDEYALRPAKDRDKPYLHETVYVGNSLALFDEGVDRYKDEIDKPAHEVWVSYAGTLGASYDLKTLIKAAALLNEEREKIDKYEIRVKILGDGPELEMLKNLATSLGAPVDFLGYVEYAKMAAYLASSDIMINSLVRTAAQSIVTKIGDYLASAKPLINTGTSEEFRDLVRSGGFGVNVEAENPEILAQTIHSLAQHPSQRKIMGAKGRALAEAKFDQAQSYKKIVSLIYSLTT